MNARFVALVRAGGIFHAERYKRAAVAMSNTTNRTSPVIEIDGTGCTRTEFSRPGVPPSPVLAAQFEGSSPSRAGTMRSSDGPKPSGSVGHSPKSNHRSSSIVMSGVIGPSGVSGRRRRMTSVKLLRPPLKPLQIE